MKYPNIYYSIKSTHEYVDQVIAETHNSAVPGFTTSLKTRPIIIAKMEEFIRNNLIKILSPRVYIEMKTFIWANGRPQAMRGYNDDLIMALSIGCWVRDTAFEGKKRETEYKEAMLNSIIKSDSVINTTIPGMHGYKPGKQLDPKKEEVIKKFMWLYKG